MAKQITPEVGRAHWAKTRNLMFTTLGVWAFFSFFIHFFAIPMNALVLFGFPLGYYMAAQGSLIIFVLLIFWFCSKQNQIDEEFGVAED